MEKIVTVCGTGGRGTTLWIERHFSAYNRYSHIDAGYCLDAPAWIPLGGVLQVATGSQFQYLSCVPRTEWSESEYPR
jgi:hypothetical protein